MSDEGRKLYIGGLSWSYTDDDLRLLCEKYGTIDDGKTFDRSLRPKLISIHLKLPCWIVAKSAVSS